VAIAFDCPECGKTIRVKDELGGQKGKCPKCDKVVRIPFVEILPEQPEDIYEKGHYLAYDEFLPIEPKPREPRTSALAGIGLALSILGATSLFGIILGILALKVLGENPGLKGRYLALAAIIVGAAWLVAVPFVLLWVIPLIR
jgi:hypothetical protein